MHRHRSRARRCSASRACRRQRAGRVRPLSALFADEASATHAAAVLLCQASLPSFTLKSIHAVPMRTGCASRSRSSHRSRSRRSSGSCRVGTSRRRVPSKVIRLDPGMAFGTGTHATTRMCLRWIAQHAAERSASWSRVLDYGCGSGILAIGAALHGARGIDAVDIDAAAIDATRANAQANDVQLNAASPQAARRSYALVLANILATPLKLLAPLLCAHVATRRRSGAGRHPGTPGRRAAARLCAMVRAAKSPTARTAGC